jgi:hypothetical protein
MDVEVLTPASSRPGRGIVSGGARIVLFAVLAAAVVSAQTSSLELRQILERLEGLERANRELTEEVRALRGQLSVATAAAQAKTEPPATVEQAADDRAALEEQVSVQKQQLQEQAQTKVESSQRFPIRLKGMVLFNTFINSKQGGEQMYPSIASHPGDANGGASLRQSVFGFEYQGPEVAGGGKMHASLMMDFFGGTGGSLDQYLRIRTADVTVDWKNRSLMLGIDKPIFSPRDPTSLAQVGISPLTGAGNLWMWIPQIRYEQRYRFSDEAQVRAQVGVVATREIPSYQTSNFVADVEPSRPGLEGRLEFSRNFNGGRRIEVAPGFHLSTSHVAHLPVPSRVASFDWLVSPWRKMELIGAVYTGQNVAHLGTGGIGEGFAVSGPGQVRALHSRGGWSQLTWTATDRLSFHLFAGRQNDHNPELPVGEIGTNFAYGANFFYRLAPNLILSVETSQTRTSYIGIGPRLNNHYDLAFAYLF